MKPLIRNTALGLSTYATTSLAFAPQAFAAPTSAAASSVAALVPITVGAIGAALVAGFVGWGVRARRYRDLENQYYQYKIKMGLEGADATSAASATSATAATSATGATAATSAESAKDATRAHRQDDAPSAAGAHHRHAGKQAKQTAEPRATKPASTQAETPSHAGQAAGQQAMGRHAAKSVDDVARTAAKSATAASGVLHTGAHAQAAQPAAALEIESKFADTREMGVLMASRAPEPAKTLGQARLNLIPHIDSNAADGTAATATDAEVPAAAPGAGRSGEDIAEQRAREIALSTLGAIPDIEPSKTAMGVAAHRRPHSDTSHRPSYARPFETMRANMQRQRDAGMAGTEAPQQPVDKSDYVPRHLNVAGSAAAPKATAAATAATTASQRNESTAPTAGVRQAQRQQQAAPGRQAPVKREPLPAREPIDTGEFLANIGARYGELLAQPFVPKAASGARDHAQRQQAAASTPIVVIDHAKPDLGNLPRVTIEVVSSRGRFASLGSSIGSSADYSPEERARRERAVREIKQAGMAASRATSVAARSSRAASGQGGRHLISPVPSHFDADSLQVVSTRAQGQQPVVPVRRGPGFVDSRDSTFVRSDLGANGDAWNGNISLTDSISDFRLDQIVKTYHTQGDMVRVEYPQQPAPAGQPADAAHGPNDSTRPDISVVRSNKKDATLAGARAVGQAALLSALPSL